MICGLGWGMVDVNHYHGKKLGIALKFKEKLKLCFNGKALAFQSNYTGSTLLSSLMRQL